MFVILHQLWGNSLGILYSIQNRGLCDKPDPLCDELPFYFEKPFPILWSVSKKELYPLVATSHIEVAGQGEK